MTAVLEAFADKDVRLLNLGAGSVSISHEILLIAWGQLSEWLQDDLDDRVRYARLRADARMWDVSNRTSSYLYSPGRLDELDAARRRWASSPGRYPPLDTVSAAFVSAARQVVRAAVRRRRAVMATLTALTVTATVAVWVAAHYAVNANQQHAVALSRQLAAQSLPLDSTDPVTARRLAVVAWSVSPTSQAGSALTKFLAEQQESGELPTSPGGQLGDSLSGVNAVAISPDAGLLAVASPDGAQLWDVATGIRSGAPLYAQRAEGGNSLTSGRANFVIPSLTGVNAVAFSPDGRLLASADESGYVQLWNIATRRLTRELLAAEPFAIPDVRGASALAFSPDGKVLATVATQYSHVQLWRTATGARIGKPFLAASLAPGFQTSNIVYAIKFSPDGKLLATGSSGSSGDIRIWDAQTGKLLVRKSLPAAQGQQSGANALAFSPDGHVLASADPDGRLMLWGPQTGEPIRQPLQADPQPDPFGTDNGLRAVAFSPDGSLLATGDGRGIVRLWNTASYSPVGAAEQARPDGSSIEIALLGSGYKLMTGPDEDGYVRLWDSSVAHWNDSSLPTGSREGAQALTGQVLSPDGMLLASANDKGTVSLRSTLTGKIVGKPLGGDSGDFANVQMAFSPDSKMLVTAGENDASLRFWNPATGAILHKPIRTSVDPSASLENLAFDPNGRLVATGDGNGEVRLWDVATGLPPVRRWTVTIIMKI